MATAIRIGNPASWQGATDARDESGGTIDFVSDDEIVSAWKLLAQREGMFCEPASAASVAGLLKAACGEKVAPNSTVVCVLTGNGLKDPDNAIKFSQRQSTILPADQHAIMQHLKLG